jgi:hypothetical protein
MPYRGSGFQFSIRVPRELWERIEAHFAQRNQSHLAKNDMVLTLLKERLRQIDTMCAEKQDKRGGTEEASGG